MFQFDYTCFQRGEASAKFGEKVTEKIKNERMEHPQYNMVSASPMHGHRSRGTGDKSPPPEFGAGGIVPPDFVMSQNFKHQITCITM